LKEIGKLTGELRAISGFTVNNNNLTIVNSPQFATLSTGLLNIARAHPEARTDIISLLRQIDDEPEPPKPNGAHPPMMMIEGELAHVA
jgi:hypothetical protein